MPGLQRAVPASKHAGGRHPKMTEHQRRIRKRVIRARIAAVLDAKAIKEA